MIEQENSGSPGTSGHYSAGKELSQMKKWKPILAAAVIFLLLNGCGAGEDLPSPEAGADSQPAQENLQKDVSQE